MIKAPSTNLVGGRFDLRLWRSPSDRRRHFRARGDRGDPRAPRAAPLGAAAGASAEPGVRGGVRREWLGPGPSARRRREGGRVPRGGRARGSGLAGVIFQSSAHAGGGRGRVRRCGIGLRCPSMERSVKTDPSDSPTVLFNGGVRFQSAGAAGRARVRWARAERLVRVQRTSAETLVPCAVILASAMASEAAGPGG